MKKPIRKKPLTDKQKLRIANKEIKDLAATVAQALKDNVVLEENFRDCRIDLKTIESDRREKRQEVIQLKRVINRAEESLRSRLRVIGPRDHYAEPEMISPTKQYTEKCVCACEQGMDRPYNPEPAVPVKTEECRLVEYLLLDVLSERCSESKIGAAPVRNRFGQF